MRITQNAVRDILSAMIADHWVIKHDRAGRVILCRKPVFAADREFSEAQQGQQGRFREAVLYAKSAIGKETIYTLIAASTGRIGFNVAIADWFHPPEIEMIDLSEWTGRPGEHIAIRALDDVMVKRVMVVITSSEEVVIEHGDAVQEAAQEADASWWVYTTTQAAPGNPKVIALAVDLPGNVTQVVASMVKTRAA
jgi:hypothetical protein